MIYLSIVVMAYLLGSVSFAVVVSAALRLSDPRTYGSKNPGATNVLRSGNKLAAVLTLLGDAAKGVCAVWLAKKLGSYYGAGELAVALAACAVFIGHLYPIFFGFKGGKGVATAAGVLFAIHPLLGLATAVTWLTVALCFRYSSLAALIAACLAPLYQIWVAGIGPVSIAVIAISILLIYRHRSNIRKLLARQEGRLGETR